MGLAIIRGPFTYLGALPEIAVVDPQRFAPPAGGAGAAPSPDGHRLLLFEAAAPGQARGPAPGPAPGASPTSALQWIPVVVDLETMDVHRGTERRADRRGRWISGDAVVLGDAEPRRIGPGGGLVAADAAPDAAAPPWTIAGDPAVLRVAADASEPRRWLPVNLPAPPTGFAPWPPNSPEPAASAAPTEPAAPAGTLAGFAWSPAAIHRVRIDPDGTVAFTELTLRFDRAR